MKEISQIELEYSRETSEPFLCFLNEKKMGQCTCPLVPPML
jgi:hypothetical protein